MMKNDIEKLIKNALDGYEMPYKDGAWESFEKNMNDKSSKHSYKWWFYGAAAIVVALSTIFFLNDQKSEVKLHSEIKIDEGKTISGTNHNDKSSKHISVSTVSKKKEKLILVETTPKLIPCSFGNPEVREDNNTNSLQNNPNKVVTSENNFSKNSNELIDEVPKNENNNLNSTEIENIPTFSDKCKNELISVENKNVFELILRTPSGREIGIDAISKSDINLKEIGVYQIGCLNEKTSGVFKEVSNFKVFALPTLSLNIDELISFKNGLPVINAEANSTEENVIWKVNQKGTYKTGKTAEFNFFNKGAYTITAQIKNESGCEITESKSVQINEDYNLLAMSAFNTNSLDYRNSAFLPYALKERVSAFRMIILDPDNGGVVFETTEASNPWTGIDRRDGKMVEAQKAYIWKVTLSNPEPGEKVDYKGTVVRVL